MTNSYVLLDCPDTCCQAWQIIIDKDSMEKYRNITNRAARNLQAACVFLPVRQKKQPLGLNMWQRKSGLI